MTRSSATSGGEVPKRDDAGARKARNATLLRSASAILFALQMLILCALGWVLSRMAEMRCGPDPPDPHTGFCVSVLAVPVASALVVCFLLWRARAQRTVSAAGATLAAALLGSASSVAALGFSLLVALGC
jgi:hypothetical protein